MSILELLLRLVITYISLVLLARAMGRKGISQMTFFNFVSAISLGTIGATFAVDPSLSFGHGMIALVFWSMLTIIFGFLDIKSSTFRLVAEGQPLILIKNGKIMEDELRKARLDLDALSSLLRKQSVFGFSGVAYAIFETDGTLSVMKKEEKQSVIREDMKITPAKKTVFSMPVTVISDGKINKRNLEMAGLDQQWLENQLQAAHISSAADVFIAEVQQDGTLYIDRKKS
jgi:uncharacterized membrane protein YcaP (DUF421 family)